MNESILITIQTQWSRVHLLPAWTTPLAFVGMVGGKCLGEAVLDAFIWLILSGLQVKKLPSRVSPNFKTKGLEALQAIDWAYLAVNQIVESVFALSLLDLVWNHSDLTWDGASIWNTVVAIYATFYADDLFYYVFHRVMHHPWLYAWVHKHHHRQALPRRGYLDAGNEHPLEQVGGLGCVWLAVALVRATLGMHGAATLAFFVIYATFAVLNHTPFDVRFPEFLGLGYSVQAHEDHHLHLRCNYAQNTMLFDKVLGTFWNKPHVF